MSGSRFAGTVFLRATRWAACALFVAAVVAPVHAQGNAARISGQVVDEEGNPVADVTVVFAPAPGTDSIGTEARTNKKGKYAASARIGTYVPGIAEEGWEVRSLVFSARAADGSKAGEFNSPVCGSLQRLPGGNTLITESTAGRVFELTPSQEVVWDWRSPHRVREDGVELIAMVGELTRHDAAVVDRWLAALPEKP